jgi:hypothetical protein
MSCGGAGRVRCRSPEALAGATPLASTGRPSICASTRSTARPEGERTSKSTSIVSPSNVASGFGERIVTTGGSLAATEAVSVLRLAASLAWRTASPSSRVFNTSLTMSGRLKRSEKREAGKKSASCVQPRLRCQPIRSSPPADAM